MKKKKTIFSVATAAILLLSLSFGSVASAYNVEGAGSGGPPPPKCIPGKPCPIQ
ncbi:hypothetical protein ACQKII_22565 [Lysinibacillus sp. NPDC048646]|uniref:hypothetical protein n=1 Tax=Lysinibacillus sp. NPDC048646 TaxID=3390574 RepID=UPI003CFD6B88